MRAAIRKELSKEANFLGLIDFPGLAVEVLNLVSERTVSDSDRWRGVRKLDLKRSYSASQSRPSGQGLR
jgi:hypothetical protein